jgi:hypothetical protein
MYIACACVRLATTRLAAAPAHAQARTHEHAQHDNIRVVYNVIRTGATLLEYYNIACVRARVCVCDGRPACPAAHTAIG